MRGVFGGELLSEERSRVRVHYLPDRGRLLLHVEQGGTAPILGRAPENAPFRAAWA